MFGNKLLNWSESFRTLDLCLESCIGLLWSHSGTCHARWVPTPPFIKQLIEILPEWFFFSSYVTAHCQQQEPRREISQDFIFYTFNLVELFDFNLLLLWSSLCLCVFVSLCLCVFVSLCLCVFNNVLFRCRQCSLYFLGFHLDSCWHDVGRSCSDITCSWSGQRSRQQTPRSLRDLAADVWHRQLATSFSMLTMCRWAHFHAFDGSEEVSDARGEELNGMWANRQRKQVFKLTGAEDLRPSQVTPEPTLNAVSPLTSLIWLQVTSLTVKLFYLKLEMTLIFSACNLFIEQRHPHTHTHTHTKANTHSYTNQWTDSLGIPYRLCTQAHTHTLTHSHCHTLWQPGAGSRVCDTALI